MNNRKLISNLSVVITILSKLVSELANDSSNLTQINDENIAQLPKIQNKIDRYSHLAVLLNNTILPNKITVKNPRISTSDLITEIMKYPKYKPEKEEDIHGRRNTINQYLSEIKKRELLSKKYKVVRSKENYYCKDKEKKET